MSRAENGKGDGGVRRWIRPVTCLDGMIGSASHSGGTAVCRGQDREM